MNSHKISLHILTKSSFIIQRLDDGGVDIVHVDEFLKQRLHLLVQCVFPQIIDYANLQQLFLLVHDKQHGIVNNSVSR